MINILRIFKFALQGFFRNFWLSVVTVTMMLMAVFSITLLFGMNYVKDVTIKTVENQVDILVEIRPNVSREQVENFVADLEDLEEIKDISIISPEQNKELFVINNKDKKVQEVLDIYNNDENPFSYSLAVKAYKLSQYSNIIDFLDNEKYASIVETSDIDTHEEVINTVNNAADFINKYSWYLAGVFLLISVVVIFNTIRISIYTRRDEIMIMKLVGASNWFIRFPFVVESIFYALVAILVVLLLIFPLVNFIQPYFNNYFQGTQVIDLIGYFKNNFVSIFVYQFLVLAFLNMLSTAVAIRRYLRV
ncbi:permease-like cell division protein FtsX [Patescibacteria group bacterium]|nr:permease-like cell division protein FtsX [Patescibacteria group bacterium]